MPSIFGTLFNGLASVALFSLCYLFLANALASRPTLRKICIGLLFGLGATASMLHPYSPAPGVVIDARAVLPALACAFGGPVAAMLAGLLPGAYRIFLGGDGAVVGALSPILTSAIGWAVWHLTGRHGGTPSFRQIAWIAVLAGTLPRLMLLLLPDRAFAINLLLDTGPVLVLFNIGGIMVIGAALRFGLLRTDSLAQTARAEAMLSGMFDNSNDALYVSASAGRGTFRLLAVNSNALKTLGMDREDVIGKLFSEFLPPERFARVTQAHMNALSGMQMVRWEDEVVVSDERRCFENTLVPVAGSGQVPTMIYSTRRDITAQKEADRLRELAATTDALTGLRNRRFAEERLAAEFERAKRYGQLLSVLIMDIDHFKQVNDTYGHDTGDRVIKQFGALLQRHARSTDVVARWGGEEFLLIAPHTDIAGAMQNAERICAAARCLALPADQQEIRFTVSIGVAQFGQEAHPLDLVKTADQALYLVKRTGRDRALQSGTFAHQGPGPVLRL